MYLKELQSELIELTGSQVHQSTLCRTLQRLGMTRKKVSKVALQQSESMVCEFMAEISAFDPSMLLWLDERGSSRRESIRKYGYSFKGLPAISHKLKVSGKRLNAISLMSCHGLLDVYVTDKNVNGSIFTEFVRTSVLPNLQAYNGVNGNSVLIMDNASIHHLDNIQDLVKKEPELLSDFCHLIHLN